MNYRQPENELKNNHKNKMEKIIMIIKKKSQVQHKHLLLLNCGRYGDKTMCRLLNADSSQQEKLVNCMLIDSIASLISVLTLQLSLDVI